MSRCLCIAGASLQVAAVAYLLAILPGVSISGTGQPQTGRVVGRVEDTSGRRLPYANARVLGTGDGAFSREDGVFLLRLPPTGAEFLYVTAIGYNDTTLALQDASRTDTLRVVLRSRWKLRGDPDAAERLIHELQASQQVEAFLVTGRLTPIMDAPNIYGYAIVATCPPPDTAIVGDLCRVLLEASRDSCGSGPSLCVFSPRYAFRFRGHTDTLVLLVNEDCHDLYFRRGAADVPTGCGGGYQCVADDLRRIMTAVCPKEAGR